MTVTKDEKIPRSRPIHTMCQSVHHNRNGNSLKGEERHDYKREQERGRERQREIKKGGGGVRDGVL